MRPPIVREELLELKSTLPIVWLPILKRSRIRLCKSFSELWIISCCVAFPHSDELQHSHLVIIIKNFFFWRFVIWRLLNLNSHLLENIFAFREWLPIKIAPEPRIINKNKSELAGWSFQENDSWKIFAILTGLQSAVRIAKQLLFQRTKSWQSKSKQGSSFSKVWISIEKIKYEFSANMEIKLTILQSFMNLIALQTVHLNSLIVAKWISFYKNYDYKLIKRCGRMMINNCTFMEYDEMFS